MKLIDIINDGQLLTEALTLGKAKQYTSIKRNPEIIKRMDSIISGISKLKNAKVSRNGHRVYVPAKRVVTTKDTKNTAYKMVTGILSRRGYKVVDYIKNKAEDEYGRVTKITKLLSKHDEDGVLQMYNNDESRKSSNRVESNYYFAFSTHQYDIAGASTDRDWTSCMNLYTGGMGKYIRHDIKQGTIVCYLISDDDFNIEDPIARAFIKPYVSIEDINEVYYHPDKFYGNSPSGMYSELKSIIEEVQGEVYGVFNLDRNLYCDSTITINKYTDNLDDILAGKASPKNAKEVEGVLKYLKFKNYTINDDLSVDVDGDVVKNATGKLIPIKFGKVNGNFKWSDPTLYRKGDGLISLRNSPEEVGGEFYCGHNNLTSLDGAPEKVDGDFFCNDNNLISLKGAPKHLKGSFNCNDNNLTSLEGAPKQVDSFFCQNNAKQFTEDEVRAVCDVKYFVYV